MIRQHLDFANQIIGRYLDVTPRPYSPLSLFYLQSPDASHSEPVRQTTVLHDIRNIHHSITENNILNLHLSLQFVGSLLEKSVREIVTPELRQLRMLEKQVTVLRHENTILRERTAFARSSPAPSTPDGRKAAPASSPQIGSTAAVSGIRRITELLETYERIVPAFSSPAQPMAGGSGQANGAAPFLPGYIPAQLSYRTPSESGRTDASLPLGEATAPATMRVASSARGQAGLAPRSSRRTGGPQPLTPASERAVRAASAPPLPTTVPQNRFVWNPAVQGQTPPSSAPVSMWRYLRLEHRLSSLVETRQEEHTVSQTLMSHRSAPLPQRETQPRPTLRPASAALLPQTLAEPFASGQGRVHGKDTPVRSLFPTMDLKPLAPHKPLTARDGLPLQNPARPAPREGIPTQRTPLTTHEEAARLVHKQDNDEAPSGSAETAPEQPKAAAPPRVFSLEPLTHPQPDRQAATTAAPLRSEPQPVPFVYREENTAPLTRELSELLRSKREPMRGHRIAPRSASMLPTGRTVPGRGSTPLSAAVKLGPMKPGELRHSPQQILFEASPAPSHTEARQTTQPLLLTAAESVAVKREAVPEIRLVYKKEAVGDSPAGEEPGEPDIRFREKTTVRTVKETQERKGETVTKYVSGGSMATQLDAMLGEMQSTAIVRRIADQVYSTLERRLRTERLRKGLL